MVKDLNQAGKQSVEGEIIALSEDLRLKRALSIINNIDFYSYQVSFLRVKAANKTTTKTQGLTVFLKSQNI